MHIESPLPRCALRGSLDPTTGIFYKASEHTRIRTVQACDKCRVRKAKCSGDHPVCERCRIRGLTCHYAPERRTRRWNKAKAEQDAVPDRSTSRSGLVPQSSGPSQFARPRSESRDTFTLHRPSSRNTDVDCPARGNMAPRRPRRTTIPSPEVHSLSSSSSSPDERAVQSDPSFSQQVLDLFRGGPDRPRTGPGHPVSGSPDSVPLHISIEHEALETTKGSMIFGGEEGEWSLDGGNDLDTPHIEENALALCFDRYTGDSPALLESILTPEATGDDVSRVTLADHHESVDGAQYLMLFHRPPRSHLSGPTPGACFDMSSVDLGTMPNDERPLLFCPSDAESPGQTPSTSSSASPILTRASSDDLPKTPTNSYPNSPFTHVSLSPHLGPFVSDPNAYPFVTSEMWAMDMGADGQDYHYHGGGGMSTEYVGWHEAKDGAHSFRGDLDLFVDVDVDAMF